jgi:hypothetical protein
VATGARETGEREENKRFLAKTRRAEEKERRTHGET